MKRQVRITFINRFIHAFFVFTVFLQACKDKKSDALTYNCNGTVCVEAANGSYSSLSACESACVNSTIRYACENGACEEATDGIFSTLNDCKVVCEGNTSPKPVVSHGAVELNGRTYKTVTVNAQTWLAENFVFDSTLSFGKEPYYVMKDKGNEKLGTFGTPPENYYFTNQLPDGWDIPTYNDFQTLINAVVPEDLMNKERLALSRLCSSGDWPLSATDDYGFNLRPVGQCKVTEMTNYYGDPFPFPSYSWYQNPNKLTEFKYYEAIDKGGNGNLYIRAEYSQTTTAPLAMKGPYKHFGTGYILDVTDANSLKYRKGIDNNFDPFNPVIEYQMVMYRLIKK